MAETSGINPKRLKSFVRHICAIAKKNSDMQKSRSSMYKLANKAKEFSSKKKEIDQELRELNRNISLVLKDSAENKESIGKINDSMNNIGKKLDYYIRIETERERKINEFEEKIRSEAKQTKDLLVLRKKLRSSESLYNKLKKKGIDVSRVKDKITELKLKLSV